MSTKNVIIGVVVIAMTVCAGFASAYWRHQPTSHEIVVDQNIRAWLGVKSIRSLIKPEPGREYFALSILSFENGKVINNWTATSGKLRNNGEWVELLWGATNDECRLTLNIEGSRSRNSDPFWKNLDFAFSSAGDQGILTIHETYGILGFAQSKDGIDPVNDSIGYKSFAEALKKKKHVGALAIRFYTSQGEAESDN